MASISLRQGTLGRRLAKHLLRRGTFFVTKDRINSFANMTADQAVEDLFTVPALLHPEGPLDYLDNGAPWLTNGLYDNSTLPQSTRRYMIWYWFGNEVMRDTSIRGKMTLFLHSIFTSGIDIDWRTFELFRLTQLYSMGNIKEYAYKVTLDNKMLIYLGNNLNKKTSPNENYAREFLELFTILKGQQIGTTNYTNYSEHDVIQAARVLSGFNTDTFDNKDPQTGLATGKATIAQHDQGNKQFSEAFDFQIIEGGIDEAGMYTEFGEFVDMVFNKLETARAYVRRMYRFFVSDKITDEINTDIIEPLAIQLKNDGYDSINTVKMLLKSEHFYDEDDSDVTDEIIGGKIKPPLELAFQTINFFEANQTVSLNADPANYDSFPRRFGLEVLEPLGWEWYPLTVEGYPGFYKAPNYSKSWYDQASISGRVGLPASLFEGRVIGGVNQIPFMIDVVAFVEQNFNNIDYSDQLVSQILEYTLAETPSTERFAYFEDKLNAGLSPINWAFDWLEYKKTGDKASVEVALQNLISAIMRSPEYHTF